jgi:hypothetical protein
MLTEQEFEEVTSLRLKGVGASDSFNDVGHNDVGQTMWDKRCGTDETTPDEQKQRRKWGLFRPTSSTTWFTELFERQSPDRFICLRSFRYGP